MREYAKVGPQFWTSETGKALRRRGSDAVIVALYLITSPHSNMLGLYYQPIPYMGHETGLGEEGARKGLQACIEVGLASYDPDSEMVWVHEMAAWQVADELKPGDKRCKGIQKDYDALPRNPFLGPWFDRYAVAFHLANRRTDGGPPDPRQGSLLDDQNQGPPEAPSQAPSKPGAGTGAGAGTGDLARARSSPPPASAPAHTREPPDDPARASADPPPEANGHSPTAAGLACRAMRQAGLQDTNPGDPRLLALLGQGATLEEFAGIAAEAVQKRRGFAWVLTVLQSRRAEAAAIALAPPPGPKPGEPTGRQPLYVPPPDLTPAEKAAADAKRREVMAKHRTPRGATP